MNIGPHKVSSQTRLLFNKEVSQNKKCLEQAVKNIKMILGTACLPNKTAYQMSGLKKLLWQESNVSPRACTKASCSTGPCLGLH